MAFLTLGAPMEWEETKKYASFIRKHGIIQFIHAYKRMLDRKKDCLLWGDEVEYLLVVFDNERKLVKLNLRAEKLITELNSKNVHSTQWHPEYAKYMIEGTPAIPYGNSIKDLLEVENNMRYRRQMATSLLKDNEGLFSVVSFPRLGYGEDYLFPYFPSCGPISQSQFVPDEIFHSHPRFGTLTNNIRTRRGKKISINIPVFKDFETPSPFIDPAINDENCTTKDDYKVDHIYMDAMVFGMGCCCLQITFQACNIDEARKLYDQLAVLTPIFLALTAASPVFRGYLVDRDCRWDVISAAVDDRTPEELGLQPLKEDKFLIPKSRYSSIDIYISNDPQNKPEYNDLSPVFDQDIYDTLIDNQIDTLLAKHLSHLFIRDPLVVFSDRIELNDEECMDHFENIQSTNWNTMRFKPPPPPSSGSDIGWRVEFRPMEVQLTDFENAAFSIFIVLLTRAILSFNLNFYIPISIVDENLKSSQKRNAVLEERFSFRRNIFSNELPEIEFYSMNELINGKEARFPGLLPVVYSYLDTLHLDIETRCQLSKYLDFIKKKASGTICTTASWIRKFIRSHKDYKFDSIITPLIQYDLFKAMQTMTPEKMTLAYEG